MKTLAQVIVPLSLLTVSCSETPRDIPPATAVEPGLNMSLIDREEFCSSVRRISKDAINGFAALKGQERDVPGSKAESMGRLYREYQENETWFHMPEASDCYISTSIDRPPGKMRWSQYRCRWHASAPGQAQAAFRDLARYIDICVAAEDTQIQLAKDGREIAWQMFRAPDASLDLYTEYRVRTSEGELMESPVLEINFKGSRKR